MAVRPIDGNALIEWLRPYLHSDEPIPADVVIEDIRSMPTLTPPNEWVSVDERLPEDGERVIATDGCFTGEAYIDCYGVWCRSNGMRWNMFKTNVTHWMPFPAPPTKEENNT